MITVNNNRNFWKSVATGDSTTHSYLRLIKSNDLVLSVVHSQPAAAQQSG